MATVSYYVHGRGRGHASRALGVARALSAAGHDVRLFAGGDATSLLQDHALFVTRAPLLPGAHAPFFLAHRAWVDARNFSYARPDIVIADGDQAALLAARLGGIPGIALGHDLLFTQCQLPPGLSLVSLAHQRVNGAIPSLIADQRVAVHFLPATVHHRGAHVARPDAPPGIATDEEFILCYFSYHEAAHVVRSAQACGLNVICFGATGKSEQPWYRPFDRAIFLDCLRRCKAVIASAGSNLLAECVWFHKPLLALYSTQQHEQALNACLAEQAGVAVRAHFNQLTAAFIRSFLSRVRQHDFARVDLAAALPPVSDVVVDVVRQTLQTKARCV